MTNSRKNKINSYLTCHTMRIYYFFCIFFFNHILFLYPPRVLAGALTEPGGGERGVGPGNWSPPLGEPRPAAAEDVFGPGGSNIQVRCTNTALYVKGIEFCSVNVVLCCCSILYQVTIKSDISFSGISDRVHFLIYQDVFWFCSYICYGCSS